jgi:hypothetical protein
VNIVLYSMLAIVGAMPSRESHGMNAHGNDA